MGFPILESTGSSRCGDRCCSSTHGRGAATTTATTKTTKTTTTTTTTGTAAKAADGHSDSAADASHPAGML